VAPVGVSDGMGWRRILPWSTYPETIPLGSSSDLK